MHVGLILILQADPVTGYICASEGQLVSPM
jgi:hypothetical protein